MVLLLVLPFLKDKDAGLWATNTGIADFRRKEIP
jgi:hypothetical protein